MRLDRNAGSKPNSSAEPTQTIVVKRQDSDVVVQIHHHLRRPEHAQQNPPAPGGQQQPTGRPGQRDKQALGQALTHQPPLPAPRAARTAISCCLDAPRANSSEARFAQAASSTMLTIPIRTGRDLRQRLSRLPRPSAAVFDHEADRLLRDAHTLSSHRLGEPAHPALSRTADRQRPDDSRAMT